MKRRSISLALSLLLLMPLTVNSAYGGMAQVLTDEQLDQVNAGGLNFNFDSMLGSANTTADSMSKSQVATQNFVGQHPMVVNPENSALQVVVVPNQPASPTSPQAPSVSAATVAPTTPQAVQDVPFVSSEVASSLPVETVAAVSVAAETPNVPAAVTALPAASVTPAQPATPQIVDVVAAMGRDMQVSFASGSASSVMPFTTTSGAMNSISIADTAQQQLRALVNVNAAGSIVPVQINLTVLMNSTVGQVNNRNDLNLSNYTTVRLQ